jgi:hypothetical protein
VDRRGVLSGANLTASSLSRTALPRARAGATARIERTIGALNGAMTATSPTGSRRLSLNRDWVLRRTSPLGTAASAAAS